MNTVSPSIGATPEERHRRRIALVGHLAWPLLALLFPVFFFWLFLRLISCAGDVPLRVCEWGFVAPLILGAAIIFCLGVAVWSLFQYDRLFALTDASGYFLRCIIYRACGTNSMTIFAMPCA